VEAARLRRLHQWCSKEVYVLDGRMIKVRGNARSKVNGGAGCVRSHLILQMVYDPDRIKQPMKRTNPRKGRDEDPGWEAISWDEAVGMLADKIVELRERGEANKFATFRGRYTNVNDVIYARLPQVIGSPNNISHSSICAEAEKFGPYYTQGYWNYRDYDIARADYALCWGMDPIATGRQVSFYTSAWGDQLERGMKIATVDPRFSNTAAKSHEWLPVIPGEDDALALAMAHEILVTGGWSREFVGDFVDGGNRFFAGAEVAEDEFVETTPTASWQWWNTELKDRTPEWAEPICGIPAAQIRRVVADMVAAAPRVVVMMGGGPNMQARGAYASIAVHALAGLLGAIDVEGGVLTGRSARCGRSPASATTRTTSPRPPSACRRSTSAATSTCPPSTAALGRRRGHQPRGRRDPRRGPLRPQGRARLLVELRVLGARHAALGRGAREARLLRPRRPAVQRDEPLRRRAAARHLPLRRADERPGAEGQHLHPLLDRRAPGRARLRRQEPRDRAHVAAGREARRARLRQLAALPARAVHRPRDRGRAHRRARVRDLPLEAPHPADLGPREYEAQASTATSSRAGRTSSGRRLELRRLPLPRAVEQHAHGDQEVRVLQRDPQEGAHGARRQARDAPSTRSSRPATTPTPAARRPSWRTTCRPEAGDPAEYPFDYIDAKKLLNREGRSANSAGTRTSPTSTRATSSGATSSRCTPTTPPASASPTATRCASPRRPARSSPPSRPGPPCDPARCRRTTARATGPSGRNAAEVFSMGTGQVARGANSNDVIPADFERLSGSTAYYGSARVRVERA
jgi:hypothetical protein